METLAGLLEEIPDDLARQAVTHASWVDRRSESWERLAFLGDAVLGLAVSSDIYPSFPRFGAGRLTKLRAQAVSRGACAEVARELRLDERVVAAAPPDRDAAGLVGSDRILASVCEAVIGAAYVAFGYERVAPAVVDAFSDQVEEALSHPVDYKSVLQERLARRGEVVAYRIESEQGPAHQRTFAAVVELGGLALGRGEGKTKKAAEQEAALEALGGEEGVRGEDRPVVDEAPEEAG